MNTTIVIAMIIVAVTGLLVGATVANTASANICDTGKRELHHPGDNSPTCIPDKSKAPFFVPKP